MKHYLFSGNESPDEAKRILIDNCEGHETMTYTKQLTLDELTELRESKVNNDLEIGRADDELKTAKEHHKSIVKPLKQENSLMLRTLRTRVAEVEGTVYLMPDHNAGLMEYVSLDGEIVHTRRLKPEEKQTRLFVADKKVANG